MNPPTDTCAMAMHAATTGPVNWPTPTPAHARAEPSIVRMVNVIQVQFLRGEGANSDAIRRVVRYYSQEGEMLAEHDPVGLKQIKTRLEEAEHQRKAMIHSATTYMDQLTSTNTEHSRIFQEKEKTIRQLKKQLTICQRKAKR